MKTTGSLTRNPQRFLRYSSFYRVPFFCEIECSTLFLSAEKWNFFVTNFRWIYIPSRPYREISLTLGFRLIENMSCIEVYGAYHMETLRKTGRTSVVEKVHVCSRGGTDPNPKCSRWWSSFERGLTGTLWIRCKFHQNHSSRHLQQGIHIYIYIYLFVSWIAYGL